MKQCCPEQLGAAIQFFRIIAETFKKLIEPDDQRRA